MKTLLVLMLGLLVLLIACTSEQKETFSFQGRINANPEFLRINQSDSVEILEKNLNYEDIPNNATYCYPKHDNVERCQWIKGVDEKYHQSCVVDLVYREICFTKHPPSFQDIYVNSLEDCPKNNKGWCVGQGRETEIMMFNASIVYGEQINSHCWIANVTLGEKYLEDIILCAE